MGEDKLFLALQALNEAAYAAFKESKVAGYAYPNGDRHALKTIANISDRLVENYLQGASE